MLKELVGWNSLRHRGFTGQEVALAMVGKPNTEDPEALCNAAQSLELIRRSYEGTRRWFAGAPEDGDTAPMGLLVSEAMQACLPVILAHAAGNSTTSSSLRPSLHLPSRSMSSSPDPRLSTSLARGA